MKIVFEDKYFQIINKDPGILSTEVSPLICHRLDKDTSGLLVIAKNKKAKDVMQSLFKKRKIEKKYLALVLGRISKEKGRIEGYIVRHKKKGNKRRLIQAPIFGIKEKHKRLAISEYKIKNEYKIDLFKNQSQLALNILTFVKIKILTGRTHQIRVQFSSLHHPVIGDLLYGGKLMKKISKHLKLKRQFLHAYKLKFIHPFTKEKIKIKIPLSQDLNKVLRKLKNRR